MSESNFTFSTYLKTTARICFKVCVDVSRVSPNQGCYNQGSTLVFNGIIGNFWHFLINS